MILRKCYNELKVRESLEDEFSLPNERCVLFLDIDGVLQPLESQKRFNYDLDGLKNILAEQLNDDCFLHLDKYDVGAVFFDWDFVSIAYLKQLLLRFNMDIVLHSSWINYQSLEQLKCLFRLHQLDDYIVDTTDPTGGESEDGVYINKNFVIRKYLEEHPEIKHYAIIDDDSSLSELGEKFVHVPNRIDEETFIKIIEAVYKE